MYYLPNAERELNTYDVFMDELKRVSKIESPYKKYAHDIVDKYYKPSIVIHHPPYEF